MSSLRQRGDSEVWSSPSTPPSHQEASRLCNQLSPSDLALGRNASATIELFVATAGLIWSLVRMTDNNLEFKNLQHLNQVLQQETTTITDLVGVALLQSG